jgi:hypothetical protein
MLHCTEYSTTILCNVQEVEVDSKKVELDSKKVELDWRES